MRRLINSDGIISAYDNGNGEAGWLVTSEMAQPTTENTPKSGGRVDSNAKSIFKI